MKLLGAGVGAHVGEVVVANDRVIAAVKFKSVRMAAGGMPRTMDAHSEQS